MFSFTLSFNNLNMISKCSSLSMFRLLEFIEILGYFSSKLKISYPLVLKILFLYLSLLFWDSDYAYICMLHDAHLGNASKPLDYQGNTLVFPASVFGQLVCPNYYCCLWQLWFKQLLLNIFWQTLLRNKLFALSKLWVNQKRARYANWSLPKTFREIQ